MVRTFCFGANYKSAKTMARRLILLFSTATTLISGFQNPTSTRRKTTQCHTLLHAERTATFGMGCFWAPSESMLKTPGIIDSIAGYWGPADVSKPPTYDDVCYGRQWVEAVRVTYDDETVSYREVLEAFFEAQVPKPQSRQYSSVIFVEDAEQEKAARAWFEEGVSVKRMRDDGLPLAITSIERGGRFFKAEGYHQNYWQKWRVRFAIAAGLLAVASGALGSVIADPALEDTIETAAIVLVEVGAVAALLERKIDAKVVEM